MPLNESAARSAHPRRERVRLLFDEQLAPPKVIWLRVGNCTTQQIAELLRLREDLIRDFAGQDDATVLELGAPAIGR